MKLSNEKIKSLSLPFAPFCPLQLVYLIIYQWFGPRKQNDLSNKVTYSMQLGKQTVKGRKEEEEKEIREK